MRPNRALVLLTAGCLVPALLSQGCATIIHGDEQEIIVSTTPPGAEIVIDGRSYGKTPTFVTLRRKHRHVVDLTLAGYQPTSETITRKFSWWYLGNLLFPGPVGIVADLLTGGVTDLRPRVLEARMHPLLAADSTAGPLSAPLSPLASTLAQGKLRLKRGRLSEIFPDVALVFQLVTIGWQDRLRFRVYGNASLAERESGPWGKELTVPMTSGRLFMRVGSADLVALDMYPETKRDVVLRWQRRPPP